MATKAEVERNKKLVELTQVKLTQYIPHVPTVKQQAFLWLECFEALFGGAAGGGKALALDTPIPTPSGWVTMDNVEPGDFVYDGHGSPTKVLACSEVMVDRPCYRLDFDDGTSIVADEDHSWQAETIRDRERAVVGVGGPNRDPYTTYSTARIAQTVKVRGHTNYSIRPSGPLQAPRSTIPVEPYLFGAWLGDGRAAIGSMCLHEPEMFDQITACGAVVRPSGSFWHVEGLTAGLRRAGVIKNKHIPLEYLRASKNQRLAVLQGLMDTDGSCDSRGQCSISTSYPHLAEGIYELLRSLGIRCPPPKPTPAYLNGERKKDRYRFKFTTALPVFRMPRKLERQKKKNFRVTHGRWYITGCNAVDSVPVRCIQVAAADGIFLAGKQMIPTHNSDALLMAALQYVDIPGYSAIIFRRTLPELKKAGSLIPRADEWLRNTNATWNDNDKQWTFPSGATLAFGYMRNDDDRHKYQSAEFQFCGMDELTSFTREQYTYMMSRVRRPAVVVGRDIPLAKVPLRMRCATNPGGAHHTWVKERFITRRDNPPEDCSARVFIPSRLADNPYIDKESYERGLMELDEATRAQLLDGSWEVRANEEWVIPDQAYIDAAVDKGAELWESGVPEPPKGEVCRFGIDWGERTASYIIWPLEDGGIFVPPSEVLGQHEDPAAVSNLMVDKAEKLRIRVGLACYDAAGVQSMRTFLGTVRKRPGWEGLRSTKVAFNKYKKEAIAYERILFRRVAVGHSSRIIAIHPANEVLIAQLKGWKFKKVADRPTDDIEKIEDHSPDALLAGVAPTAAKHRSYIEEQIQKAKEKKA